VPTSRPTPFFCRELSARAREPLRATASRIDVWFLVEVHGRWEREAFRGSRLPEAVKRHLRSAVAAVPRSRVVLIRQAQRPVGALTLVVAVSRAGRERLRRFELQDYDDVLEVDLVAAAADGAPAAGEALFLVCTHGVHDKCCALFGLPAYQALAEREGASVWQSSHIGGDRFAANLVCLPHGLYYGRVAPERAADIAAEYRAGRIVPAGYRGRSIHPFVVQAAEQFLRDETGLLGVDALRLDAAARLAPDQWAVRFAVADRLHEVEVARLPARYADHITCHAEPGQLVPAYRLLGHRVAALPA